MSDFIFHVLSKDAFSSWFPDISCFIERKTFSVSEIVPLTLRNKCPHYCICNITNVSFSLSTFISSSDTLVYNVIPSCSLLCTLKRLCICCFQFIYVMSESGVVRRESSVEQRSSKECVASFSQRKRTSRLILNIPGIVLTFFEIWRRASYPYSAPTAALILV